MQAPTWDTVRLFLHIIAATIWVGGQLTLAGLVGTVRAVDPAAPKAVARQFNRIAWPAFAVLVLTGGWNMSAVNFSEQRTSYQVTMFIKLTFVALAGIGAFLHTQARTKVGLAVWGAVGGLSSVAVLFFGILLGTGKS